MLHHPSNAVASNRIPSPANACARFCACALAFLAGGTTGSALPATSIEIENYLGEQPAAEAVLTDADGITPLTAGTSADGDGAIIALGYFTGATGAASFSGKWTPLTGPATANAGVGTTTIGDTNSQAAGPFGYLRAVVTFDAGSENYAGFRNTPPAGARLAVAIYNAATLQAATHFTLATNDAWRWRTPAIEPDPQPLRVDLNDPGTIWLGGATKARRTSEPAASFPGLAPAGRLVNISTRGFVGTGDEVMIPGFVLEGSGTTPILARAVGPGLIAHGVASTLADPVLTLHAQVSGAIEASNDNWYTVDGGATVESTIAAVGAFPILQGSRDAAAVAPLAPVPGGYTVKVSGSAGGAGIALAEIYIVDTDNPAAPRIKNISTRGFVGAGDAIMIAGFVVAPGGPQRLLIRAAGPALATSFDIAGVLEQPRLEIISSKDGGALAANDGWENGGEGPRIAAAAAQAGAFALNEGSHDAAVIFVAEPGGYTVQISGSDGSSGIVIAEVYELP
ncbi:MAG: hypothetical protein ACREIA_19000 [Opitutaceae bacterium]